MLRSIGTIVTYLEAVICWVFFILSSWVTLPRPSSSAEFSCSIFFNLEALWMQKQFTLNTGAYLFLTVLASFLISAM